MGIDARCPACGCRRHRNLDHGMLFVTQECKCKRCQQLYLVDHILKTIEPIVSSSRETEIKIKQLLMLKNQPNFDAIMVNLDKVTAREVMKRLNKIPDLKPPLTEFEDALSDLGL